MQLNILPQTKRKIHHLADTYSPFHTIASNTLETTNSSKARTYAQLHHILRKEFPELCRLPSVLIRSYFCSTAGNVSNGTICKYIEVQNRK